LLARLRQNRTIADVNPADGLPHAAVGLEQIDVQVEDDVLVFSATGAVGFVGALADVESMQEQSTRLQLADQSWTYAQPFQFL